MSNVVIKVEDVAKQYRLGQVGRKSLSQDVNRWWHTVRGKEDPYLKIGQENDRTKKSEGEYVWALQDINFEVQQGEVLGIIGRNGAGKSTLLKLLSKVTAPTRGAIKVKGRIASLLEVGTGFHPDLSGRDNIYLNGAILGMTKKEISAKFDQIVDFSGVEKYIDTPVKRYSSGMYVRLAFAVAAHLEPEILIVDEVLAVGDAEFQKKCLGKMRDVSVQDGRTVLFVSHNMAAVQKLCTTGLLMHNGTLKSADTINNIISLYLKGSGKVNSSFDFNIQPQLPAYVTRLEVVDENNELLEEIPIGRKWGVNIFYTIEKPVKNFVSAIGLTNDIGLSIKTCWQLPFNAAPGKYIARFKEDDTVLAAGRYRLIIGLSEGQRTIQYIDHEDIGFEIIEVIDEVDENVQRYNTKTGIVLNQMKMTTEKI